MGVVPEDLEDFPVADAHGSRSGGSQERGSEMKGAILVFAVFTFAGCAAHHRPVVDLATSAKTPGEYEFDLSQCQYLASKAPGSDSLGVGGAVVGAGIGALTAAILGGNAGRGAALGALYGGLSGLEQGAAIRAEAVRSCMAGRGYNVLSYAAAGATGVEIEAALTEKARPAAAAFLPPADAGPELRQSAAAAAAAFGELDRFERVELPIAIYERHLEETEARIAALAFGTDDDSMAVHAAVATILAYHHTARDIRRTKIASLDKLKRDVRAVSSPVPYFSDSEVPRWVVRYPFLRESLETPPIPGSMGELAGSWYPDRATELLWEHARADTEELAAWAAAVAT